MKKLMFLLVLTLAVVPGLFAQMQAAIKEITGKVGIKAVSGGAGSVYGHGDHPLELAVRRGRQVMSNNRNKRLSFSLLALVLVAGLSGCYYIPSLTGGTARASLTVKQPTAAITSIALAVAGPGMSTMAQTVLVADTSVTVEVPAGVGRTFTLLVNTASVSFKGEATVDLQPGETKEVVLEPVLFDTQIIVPDNYNYRIVQISDMNGSGWDELNGTDLGFTFYYDFSPYDIDFDDHGRIYIANYSYDYGGVFRIDDINDTTPEWVDQGAAGSLYIYAIAVDRVNHYIYYGNGLTIIRRKDTNDLARGMVSFDLALEPQITSASIYGIAVDETGKLYIANQSGPQIIKYDPSLAAGQRVVAIYNNASILYNPWDVVVKSPYVYITNMYGYDGYKILQLDQNLSFIAGYGSNDTYQPPFGPGEFARPSRFVAILSKRLILIDEGWDPQSFTDVDRLISLINMQGAGWVTYGTTGSGQGQFSFFGYGE